MTYCTKMLFANLSGSSYLAVAGLLYALWRLGSRDFPGIEWDNIASGISCFRKRWLEGSASTSKAVLYPASAPASRVLPSSLSPASISAPTASVGKWSTDIAFCTRKQPRPSFLPPLEALEDEVGTRFIIERPDANDLEAELHIVDLTTEELSDGGTINLYFHVSEPEELEAGTYRIGHPRLAAFTAQIERVEAGGRAPDQPGYRAVVTG